MGNLGRAIRMGITAFRESYMSASLESASPFESLNARRLRYAIYWSFYENTAYRWIHNWSTSYKHQFALYKYIRNLYNPTFRLGNFYSAHLWGGQLDRSAGKIGAVPIETISPKEDQLRKALAKIWSDSNFSRLKDVITLRGTIEGDTLLRVVDDPEHDQVFFERIDPSMVTSLDLDRRGNIKGYILEEKRQDPQNVNRFVDYKEIASRNGDFVVFETFLNNKPFAWSDQPAAWELPYGFVPMVLIKHSDVGLDWGLSELHAVKSKIHEVDDLASMVSDQIRKYVDPVWLMRGVKSSSAVQATTTATPNLTGNTDTRPEPGREEIKAIWGAPKEADPKALVTNLNLGDALAHLDRLLKELERELPELQIDLWATSVTTGRALRIARQRVEAKALQRRENYDDGLVRLQKMALSIGAMQGYSGFEGFNEESYANGDLDHQIATRPVFPVDPEDQAVISREFWTAANLAVKSGADLEGYLRSQDLSDEQIATLIPKEPEPDPEESIAPLEHELQIG